MDTSGNGLERLLDELEEKLRSIPPENVKLTMHVEIKCMQRGMPGELLRSSISNADKLVYAEKDGPLANPNRYILNFSHTKRKDLAVIVEFTNKHINIVTAYLVNKRWAKRIEKWLKKPRRDQR